jgi:hypothetical protein
MDYKKQEELAELARPLQEWLMKNYGPHNEIIVDFNGVSVKESTMFTRIM